MCTGKRKRVLRPKSDTQYNNSAKRRLDLNLDCRRYGGRREGIHKILEDRIIMAWFDP